MRGSDGAAGPTEASTVGRRARPQQKRKKRHRRQRQGAVSPLPGGRRTAEVGAPPARASTAHAKTGPSARGGSQTWTARRRGGQTRGAPPPLPPQPQCAQGGSGGASGYVSRRRRRTPLDGSAPSARMMFLPRPRAHAGGYAMAKVGRRGARPARSAPRRHASWSRPGRAAATSRQAGGRSVGNSSGAQGRHGHQRFPHSDGDGGGRADGGGWGGAPPRTAPPHSPATGARAHGRRSTRPPPHSRFECIGR